MILQTSCVCVVGVGKKKGIEKKGGVEKKRGEEERETNNARRSLKFFKCGCLPPKLAQPHQQQQNNIKLTTNTYLAFRRRRQDPSTLQTFVARSWHHHKCTCGPSREKYSGTPCGLAVPARVLVPCTGRQVLYLLLFQ